MLLVSAMFVAVGLWVGTGSVEVESSMAWISSGGPTIIEREDPSSSAVADEPAVSDGVPTTTTRSRRSGAAASSSVASLDGSSSEGVAEAPPGRSPQERGRWALDRISYPWQDRLPGWTVEFDDGREGLFGLTLVDDKRIEIYVRDDQSDDLLVHIVAHELGHAVDVTLNDGDDRRAWQAARGIEDAPWWPSSAASDFRTGAGDFAESFAYWQAESDNFRSKLGRVPDAVQLELIAELAVD